jgi:hypothetical protein
MTRGILSSALAIAMAALAGCGYTTRSSLDAKYQTIFVPAFQNASNEYDLQAALTNAVIRKFTADGRLRVARADTADLIMEGTILSYSLRGLTYDKSDEVTQFLCAVTARVCLKEQATGKVVWEDPEMAGETTLYTAAPGGGADRLRGNAQNFLPTVRSFATDAENRAASEALEQLASDIFYRTVEPF